MPEETIFSSSPLSIEDLRKIDDTKLAPLDRHYLRLLGHCLACFKIMSDGLISGPLPNEDKRLQWCLDHPMVAKDEEFIGILLEQFSASANHLEQLAHSIGVTPLELTLNDLIEISTVDKKP